MYVKLIPIFLPLLLLLLQVVVHVESRLLSVRVTSYEKWRATLNGPVRCALDTANMTSSSSSLEYCSLSCTRDDTCTGFNVKNSLTCGHVASTPRTHKPVVTWRHLYWLQHQELTHLWSRDDTCIGLNTKNSLTCGHVVIPVVASTSRTHSPVITWRHLYWPQHQELTHLWSREDTCTGFNIKNSLTCDVYNYNPKIIAPVSDCTFFQVDNVSTLLSSLCFFVSAVGWVIWPVKTRPRYDL